MKIHSLNRILGVWVPEIYFAITKNYYKPSGNTYFVLWDVFCQKHTPTTLRTEALWGKVLSACWKADTLSFLCLPHPHAILIVASGSQSAMLKENHPGQPTVQTAPRSFP